jgi:tRNA nucleotidyltransferase (CCA-adding enzyme)
VDVADEADVAGRIDAVVPASVRHVCEQLQRGGFEAYAVGGAVRDALLGRDPGDWDVATSAAPDEVMRLFPKTIPTGIQHGTVTIVVGRGAERATVEVTTFRGEGAYSDARRPDSVTFGVPLREDLARRDFVINAIAYDPIRRVFADPFDGRGDLAQRRVRAVGEARARFTEDGLRIMRGVRFSAVLEFALEAETEAAIPAALPSLAKVSVERVYVELSKLLAARQPSRGFEIARRTGILALILPELALGRPALEDAAAEARWTQAMARIDAVPREQPMVRLAALLVELGGPAAASDNPDNATEPEAAAIAEAALRRLKASNEERDQAVRLVRFGRAWRVAAIPDPALRRLLGQFGRARVPDLLALWDAELSSRDEADRPPLAALAARVRAILAAGDPLSIGELAIGGGDVMKILAIPPGRQVGQLLERLYERALVDPSINTRGALEALLQSGSLTQ